jgi:hypothetical protein
MSGLKELEEMFKLKGIQGDEIFLYMISLLVIAVIFILYFL